VKISIVVALKRPTLNAQRSTLNEIQNASRPKRTLARAATWSEALTLASKFLTIGAIYQQFFD
jgi:hypothetical protein